MHIGSLKISTACILLFGKNPQRFFPRARTRFIRYEGKQEKVGREMNVIKDVTFEGAILQQVRSTIDYLETQVSEHTFLGEHGVFVTRRNYSNMPYKRWWSIVAATEPTTSRAQRYK